MGFETFLGNPKAVTALGDMLASGRLPGALLFSGPDGVGKKTLALMMAKALNCERQPRDGTGFCGECRRCRKSEEMITAAREDLARRRDTKDSAKRVEGLVYFDLQLIEPLTRYILTEQIRQMRSVAYTHPFELPRRVFVIDEAQAIHWQAADLLLKVLEEPPATTTFILVCPNAYELRSTIRSRCLRIQFEPVEEAVIARLLEEEARVPKAQRGLAARVAAGSVAKAKSFDAAEFQNLRRPWLDFLDAVAGKPRVPAAEPDWAALFQSTKALSQNRDEFDRILTVGYDLLRDLAQTLENEAATDVINVDLRPRLGAWAKRLGFQGIELLKNGLDQAYRLQTRNVNQQVGLEDLAIEVLTRVPASPPHDK
jgi:DNA polymerase-3 subunit delta'